MIRNRQQAFNVSRETQSRLEVYERLLVTWSKVTNLIGPSELNSLWTRHFVDSLQVKTHASAGRIWADLGTGAGFPGLVLAIDSLGDTDAHFHLIEPDGRKCAFLREVVRETGAPATIHRARAEDVLGKLGRVDVLTSRAMAPLESLVRISESVLRGGATGLFLKGRGHRDELRTLAKFDDLVVETLPSVTSDDAAIIRLSFARAPDRNAA